MRRHTESGSRSLVETAGVITRAWAVLFFFSSRRRHTRLQGDWSSDVCSSDLGLPVALQVEGQQAPLPAGVDLCAYRVVQEALTNALKHAGPARAEVVLRFGARALDIEVRDDGLGAAVPNADGGGPGFIGSRDRAGPYCCPPDPVPSRGAGFT